MNALFRSLLPKIALLIVLLSPFTLAQTNEPISSEELLEWLPQENYVRLEHSDLFTMMHNSDAGLDLMAVFGTTIKRKIAEFPLPAGITNKVEAFIRCHYANNRVYINQEVKTYKPEKYTAQPQRNMFKDKKGDMQSILLVNNALEAWVFRINPEAGVKKLIQDGLLSGLPKKIQRYTVFTYITRSNERYFGCSPRADLFLVAPNLNLLRKMIDAGSGINRSLIDSPEIADLHKSYKLSGNWDLFLISADKEALLEKMKEMDSDNEAIENIENELARRPKIRFSKMTFGENIEKLEVYRFDNKVAAERQYQNKLAELEAMKSSYEQNKTNPYRKYIKLLIDRTKIEIKSNSVITVSFEDLKMMAASKNAAIKAQKKHEQEKK